MAYRHLGEVDEVVTLATSEAGRLTYFDRAAAQDLISVQRLNERTGESQGAELVDGLLSVIVEDAPVQKIDPVTREPVLMEPRVRVLALDWADLARFGNRPPSLSRPSPGEIMASDRLARELELSGDDTIQLFARNTLHTFTVKAVLSEGSVTLSV